MIISLDKSYKSANSSIFSTFLYKDMYWLNSGELVVYQIVEDAKACCCNISFSLNCRSVLREQLKSEFFGFLGQ